MAFSLTDAVTGHALSPQQTVFVMSNQHNAFECIYHGDTSTSECDLFEWLALENLIYPTSPHPDLTFFDVGHYLFNCCPHFSDDAGLIYTTRKQAACLIWCDLMSENDIELSVQDIYTPILLKCRQDTLKGHLRCGNLTKQYITPNYPLRVTTEARCNFNKMINSKYANVRRY